MFISPKTTINKTALTDIVFGNSPPTRSKEKLVLEPLYSPLFSPFSETTPNPFTL